VDDACQHGKAGGQSGDEENKNPGPALRHQCQAPDKSPRNFRAVATLKREDSGAGSEGVGCAPGRLRFLEREIAELADYHQFGRTIKQPSNGTISMLIALRLRTTPISRIHARIYRCSGRGRDHADFELGQIGYLIKEKAMQDKLRNSRQPRGQRRLRSRFNSSQVPRGGAGNVLENARRQYERYVELAQTAASSGDAVEAQNYYQHAEHFFRVMRGQEVEANGFANISDARWKGWRADE
jgi:hypothetical protein